MDDSNWFVRLFVYASLVVLFVVVGAVFRAWFWLFRGWELWRVLWILVCCLFSGCVWGGFAYWCGLLGCYVCVLVGIICDGWFGCVGLLDCVL